jgi:hypothetical protein
MGKLLGLKPADAARADLIDELGTLRQRQAAFAATGVDKRAAQLQTEISSWHDGDPPDAELVERGTYFQIIFSPRRSVSTLNVRGAYKALGLKRFLEACTVTMKALAAFLTPDQVDALVTTERTGSRSLTTTPIASAPPREAAA